MAKYQTSGLIQMQYIFLSPSFFLAFFLYQLPTEGGP